MYLFSIDDVFGQNFGRTFTQTYEIPARKSYETAFDFRRIATIEASTEWMVEFKETGTIREGVGDSFKQVKFDVPGTYQVRFFTPLSKEIKTCRDANIEEIVYLTVHPIHFEILWDKEFLYNLFSNNKTFIEYPLEVKVRATTWQNAVIVQGGHFNMQLSGVECNLFGTAELEDETVFQDGDIVTLKFFLNGTVGKGIYASLLIADSLEQYSTLNFTQPLK